MGKLVTEWNNDPSHRSKVGELRNEIEETKNVLVEDLELATQRG